jgi:hypothetical protein
MTRELDIKRPLVKLPLNEQNKESVFRKLAPETVNGEVLDANVTEGFNERNWIRE